MATNYNRIFGLSALTALLLIISVQLSYSCNEQVCASIVSKCMLTQSCKCDSKNYSCCTECFKCLGHLQLECCSCLGKLKRKQWESLMAEELICCSIGKPFIVIWDLKFSQFITFWIIFPIEFFFSYQKNTLEKRTILHERIFAISISEMCPKPTETRNVSRQSHIEDLEGIPGLFKALTEESDEDEDKWTTFTFPVDFQTVLVSPKGDKPFKYILRKFIENRCLSIRQNWIRT